MKKISLFFLLIATFFISCCGGSENSEGDEKSGGDQDISPTSDYSEMTDDESGSVETVEYGKKFPEKLMQQPVEWVECRLFDNKERPLAECADIQVPLYWSKPDGETITIHIKRLLGGKNAKKQLYMLQGGPGGSSTIDFPQSMMGMSLEEPSLDIYAFDHRGTGYSSYLKCEEASSPDSPWGAAVGAGEIKGCIDNEITQKRDYFNAFSITEASTDLAFAIELFREEDKTPFVYGVSYGSTWAHRYAQVFPNQSKAVVLDSICIAGTCFLDDYDKNADLVAKQIYDMCSNDQFCSSKMGKNVDAKVREILVKLQEGHCSPVGSVETVQSLAFMLGQMWEFRTMIPAIYYRLDRCEDEDVAAVRNLISRLFGGSRAAISLEKNYEEQSARSGNTILFLNIGISEMIKGDYSVDEINDRDKTLTVTKRLDWLVTNFKDSWPVYETDDFLGGFATEHKNFLMLNGTLDFQTPLEVAMPAKENLTGSDHHFVTVPDANHGVLWASPVKTAGKADCGRQIFFDYLSNPEKDPETSCLADLKEVDFHGNPKYVSNFMGAPDMWENEPQPGARSYMPFDDEDMEKIERKIKLIRNSFYH